MSGLGTGNGGLQFTLPAELGSGFGYRVRVSGIGPDGSTVEAFSPSFQVQGADAAGGSQGAGLCRFNETNPRHAICVSADGRPLMQRGAEFAVVEMQFLWQTCVSLHGTTLDAYIKYQVRARAQARKKNKRMAIFGCVLFCCFQKKRKTRLIFVVFFICLFLKNNN